MRTKRKIARQQPPPTRPTEKAPILITGAAGCVGTQLTEILRKKGIPLRLSDRPGTPLPPASTQVEVIPTDLTRTQTFSRLTDGVRAVVHLAAIVDIGLSLPELAPINLDAVRALYEAAERAKVKQFIFLSTGSLYAFKNGKVSETDPVNPLNDYGRSKLLAEDYLRRRPANGPRVNILRPALIFGPRGKVLLNMLAPMPALVKVLSRRFLSFAGGPATNSVHAYDVANAIAFLLEHPQKHGEIFNVANDDPVTAGDMMETVLQEGGLSPIGPRLPYPKFFFEWANPFLSKPVAIGALNRGVSGLWSRVRKRSGLHGELTPKIDCEMLDFLVHDMRFDNRKIKRLGFKLRFPDFASGWQDTIAWMREAGWLPQ